MSPVEFKPSADLYPFQSRFFDSSAGRVHYVDEGCGQPLLLLHGNPTWSFLYRDLIPKLSGRFRCVAPDQLGFGLSQRPPGFGYTPAEQAAVIGELIGELDLRELIVMGHDWGGPVGLSAASSAPDRIAGLVLGNTWFWPSSVYFRAFSRIMSTRLMQRQILERNLFVERFIPRGVVRELSEQEMDHYRGVHPTPEARVAVAEYPRQIRAASDWLGALERAVRRELGHKRVLITWPMRDTAFRYKAIAPRMRAAFDDVEELRFEDAKHYFQEDVAAEVAEAILRRFSG